LPLATAGHHDRWREADQTAEGCYNFGQRRLQKAAAEMYFHTLLQGLSGIPRVLVTDFAEIPLGIFVLDTAQQGTLPTAFVEHRSL
jgi:hypothetical protein